MYKYSIGIIGVGAMGSAILSGILNKKVFPQNKIFLGDSEIKKLKSFKIPNTNNAREIVNNCETVLICVKPQNIKQLWNEIKDSVKENQLLISILAGIPLNFFNNQKKIAVSRVMPNTPAQVAEAMSVICFNKNVSKTQKEKVVKIFSAVGKVLIMDEKKINAVTAISGSGPAYIFLFAESLISAGVNVGLTKEQATELVLQTLIGSTKMLAESKLHPAQLRDMVTSPAGTTIKAIKVLEKEKFRYSIIKAVESAYKRAKELNQIV